MIRSYLREYSIWYLNYAIVSLAFLLTFYLYHMPLVYFINSLILSLTILLITSLILYWRFHQKLKNLHHFIYVKEPRNLTMLTAPSDLVYKEILKKLLQEQSDINLQHKTQEEQLQQLIKLWSHQMKVPISALSLMAQTGHLDKEDVQRQLLRLENDLSRLLNYLKFSQNQSDFRFEKCQIRNILIDLIKKNQVFFLQKDLSLTIDGDWEIKSDKKWLSFVFSQILDNAIKYNKKGGQITIKIKENQILIKDTGIGILKEDIPRLFEEGFTGYNGHEHQKATGLGLYMTKKVLNNLELDINIESQIDQGTQVYVTKRR
ncbi:sensor histidine kinase [Streptococcus mutans]|uniref:sensor histidine kinase n=1 Tax=Streptococcus mutans TaxID=1309 RepID=UPI0002BE8997|nr:sensor histidine kinase [Streptococcus mutans]EMP68340.1 two-component sensor histidine kinase [Streptococcus mutans NCTC 11060]